MEKIIQFITKASAVILDNLFEDVVRLEIEQLMKMNIQIFKRNIHYMVTMKKHECLIIGVCPYGKIYPLQIF